MLLYFNRVIGALGRSVIGVADIVIGVTKFSANVLRAGFFSKNLFNPVILTLIVRQIYYTGVELFMTMTLTSILLGLAVVGGLSQLLIMFGATASIGSVITIVLVRTAAPFIVGLLLIFRTSTTMYVDIAMMNMNKEISALENMGIDPYKVVYFPRIAASVLSMFILSSYVVVISIIGGFMLLSFQLNTTLFVIGQQIIASLNISDVLSYSIKVILIGFMITAIPIYSALDEKRSEIDLIKSLNKAMIRVFYFFVVVLTLVEFLI